MFIIIVLKNNIIKLKEILNKRKQIKIIMYLILLICFHMNYNFSVNGYGETVIYYIMSYSSI